MKKLIFTCLSIAVLTGILAYATKLPSFPNAGVLTIDHPEAFDRVFAVSDVHGMYTPLINLLLSQHIISFDPTGGVQWEAKKSLFIVVGDSIDKGPDSLDVLEFWRALSVKAIESGGLVVHLLGNHEAEFLADPINSKTSALQTELSRKNFPVQELLSPEFPLGKYLREMYLAARVGNWLFCHAGLYPQMSWGGFSGQASNVLSQGLYGSPLLSADSSILEAKDWWADPAKRLALEQNLTKNDFYGVVFGHQPKALGVENDIAGIDQLRIIKIDSGMAPEAGANPGHMVLFQNAAQLSAMVPPVVFSLSAASSRRLPTQ